MRDVVVVGGIFREIHLQPNDFRIAGSGLTSALISARFGAKTTLASYVGDEDIEIVRAQAEIAQLQLELVPLPGASGTFVFGRDQSSPAPLYRPAEATPALVTPNIAPASVVAVFGIPDFDPVDAGWLTDMDASSTLIWDRQGWLSRARDANGIRRLGANHKIYVANEREAADEFDADALDLRHVMPPEGFETAVIKRGDAGCTIFDCLHMVEGQSVLGYPVQVASTVGSGDVFLGALAASLSQGADMIHAVQRGNAAASAYLALGRDPLAGNLLQKTEQLVSSGAGTV